MIDPDPLSIVGELIADKYRIERMVGEGGFAVVYRAEHVVWQQPVAVKLFSGLSQAPSESRDALQRDFIREGALLTELSSQTAGIVQARDVGTYATPDGQWMPYMVLEWLEGSPLDAVLDQDQAQGMVWTEGEVLGFLTRVLPILEVAHGRGIAHRDIKPANIFVMGSAARSTSTPLKLLDFGVAKMVSDHTRTSAALAKTGLAITSFTPQYGAPEQFTRSYGATGPWTDVYALALVAAEMIVGRPVLEGEDVVQLGFSTANPDRRPTPEALGVRVSVSFEAMLSKALAVYPEERFAGAAAFLEACTDLAAERGISMRPPLLTGSRPPSSSPASLAATERAVSPPAVRPRMPASPLSPDVTRWIGTQNASASTLGRTIKPPRESAMGILLVLVVAAAGGTLVFSATDLPGANNTRDRVFALVSAGREQLGQWFPSGERAAGSPAAPACVTSPAVASAPPVRHCPEGMRGVVAMSGDDDGDVSGEDVGAAMVGAASGGRAGTSTGPLPTDSGRERSRRIGGGGGGTRDGGASGGGVRPSCVDEQPVREVDYAACAKCRRPHLAHFPMDADLPPPSKFCLSGKSPTDQTLDCVTLDQARAFCATRGARLPTQAELDRLFKAMSPPSPANPAAEWTAAEVKSSKRDFRAFRCVLVDE